MGKNLPENLPNNFSNSGFTLLEILVVIIIISVLSAIAVPSWLNFVANRRLNVAQDEIYQAMRAARSQAEKRKLTWQASFREKNGILQWSVHSNAISPIDAIWNNLDSDIRLDNETTFKLTKGIIKIQFDHQGNVKPPLGRITIYTKYGGKMKRCVYVSTILGAMKKAKERDKPKNGKYCY
ncbi:MAG: prepilin-type N-terminal cleavage/methylation domain-containing protein [Cyanobacteria bacterium P01_A01_bin.84]